MTAPHSEAAPVPEPGPENCQTAGPTAPWWWGRTGESASGSPCPARPGQSLFQWQHTSSGRCWIPVRDFPAQNPPLDAHGGETIRCRFHPQGWEILNGVPQNHCRTATPPGVWLFCCPAHCTRHISPAWHSRCAPGAL